MNSGIYKLTFQNGSTYIGKSVDMKRRWQEHADSMRKGTAAKKMQNAYILAGFPDVSILVECHPDHIDLMESVYITLQNPNLNSSVPIKLSDEEIDMLLNSTDVLGFSTAVHITLLKSSSASETNLKNEIEELEQQVEDLIQQRSEEELKLELGRRLARVEGQYETLTHRYDILETENRGLLNRINIPWYKKLFGG
jgi:hypothetical protein